MNYPAASCGGIKKSFLIIFPEFSPPNVLVGGPVGISPGFPLKACGNDGLREGIKFYAASCGESDPL